MPGSGLGLGDGEVGGEGLVREMGRGQSPRLGTLLPPAMASAQEKLLSTVRWGDGMKAKAGGWGVGRGTEGVPLSPPPVLPGHNRDARTRASNTRAWYSKGCRVLPSHRRICRPWFWK